MRFGIGLILIGAAMMCAPYAAAQLEDFPAESQVYVLSDFRLAPRAATQFEFSHSGFKIAGYLGTSKVLHAIEDGFAVSEGDALRHFRVDPGGEVTLQGTYGAYPGERERSSEVSIPGATPERLLLKGHSVIHEFTYEHAFEGHEGVGMYRSEKLYDIQASGVRLRAGYTLSLEGVSGLSPIPARISSEGKDYLVVARFGGVGVVDCDADPPRIVSWTSAGGIVSELDYHDGYIYARMNIKGYPVASQKHTWTQDLIAVIDARNPETISRVNVVPLGDVIPEDRSDLRFDSNVHMRIVGNRIYYLSANPFDGMGGSLRNGDRWARVLDISDPVIPQIIVQAAMAPLPLLEGQSVMIDVGSNTALITTSEDALTHSAETSNPNWREAPWNFLYLDTTDPSDIRFIKEYPIGIGTPYRGRLLDMLKVGEEYYCVVGITDIVDETTEGIVNGKNTNARAIIRYDFSGEKPVPTWTRFTAAVTELDGDIVWHSYGSIITWADISDPTNPKFDYVRHDEDFGSTALGVQLGEFTGGERAPFLQTDPDYEAQWDWRIFRPSSPDPVRPPYHYELERNSTEAWLRSYRVDGLVESNVLVSELSLAPWLRNLWGQTPRYTGVLAISGRGEANAPSEAQLFDLSDPANPRIAGKVASRVQGGDAVFPFLFGYWLVFWTRGHSDGKVHRDLYDVSDLDNPRFVNSVASEVFDESLPPPSFGLHHDAAQTSWGYYRLPHLLRLSGARFNGTYNSLARPLYFHDARLVSYENPLSPRTVASSSIVGPQFHGRAFNGKYFLGVHGFIPGNRGLSNPGLEYGGPTNANTRYLLLEPTFIDFPAVQVYPAPVFHGVSWEGGRVRSEISMDKSPIATNWIYKRVGDEAWLDVSQERERLEPSEGAGQVYAGDLILEFEDNLTPFSRQAEIQVTASSPNAIEAFVVIRQDGIPMDVSPTDIAVHPSGGSVEVAVDIDGHPTVWHSAVEDAAGWCAIASEKSGQGDGSFIVAVDENTSGTPREASIRVWSDLGHEATVVITQRAYVPGELSVGPLVVRVDNDAQDASVFIANIGETPVSWNASILAASWVQIDETGSSVDGVDGRELALRIDENMADNQRRAVLSIQSEGENAQQFFVAIIQDGAETIIDVDDDGSLTATDIQMVINYLLGLEEYCNCADLDGNGRIDSIDVQLIINAVLEK